MFTMTQDMSYLVRLCGSETGVQTIGNKNMMCYKLCLYKQAKVIKYLVKYQQEISQCDN